MIQFIAVYVRQVFQQFGTSIDGLLREPDTNLSDAYKEAMSKLAAFYVIEQHREVFLDDNLSLRVWRLRNELKNGEPFTAASLARELQGLLGQMIGLLSKRKFAYIPPPNDDYFEQDRLFGEDVYVSFEEARDDIRDAGNCFAAQLYTACVFHLMRVAEYGLRSLARKEGVTIKHTGTIIPLEYGEWDQIIRAIDERIAAARLLARDAERERQLQLYSEANQHCLFMKDIFRNTVSHTRKPYDYAEALSGIGQVRNFMQFIAKAEGLT